MADQPTNLAPELVVVARYQMPQCEEKAWGSVHGCSCLRTEGHLDLHTKEQELGSLRFAPKSETTGDTWEKFRVPVPDSGVSVLAGPSPVSNWGAWCFRLGVSAPVASG